jgi:hypothetical protein
MVGFFAARWGVLTVVGAVFVGVVPPAAAVAATASAPAASVPDSAADEATATRWARDGNKQVLVTSKTSETSQTFANPDGSWSLTQYTHPVRVLQSGAWAPIDTTLAKRADGTVHPKATTVDVTVNPGGPGSAETPIVKAGDDGKEVGLKWASDLPVPVLSGDTATYAGVLPDVDLVVKAAPEGYTETLVIKTREAARNPALAKVGFGLHTKNTTVTVAKGEGRGKPTDVTAQTPPSDAINVLDTAGQVMFTGDASRMWDSSGNGTPTEKALGTGEGRREAAMGVELAQGRIAISPDQAFLADPATTYPVSLDPDNACTSCGIQAHVVVQSGFPNAHNYNVTAGDLSDLKAGYEDYDNAGTSESFVQMNTAQVAGTVIKSATLNTTVTSTYNCTGTKNTDLYWTGPIDGNTTWNSRPGRVAYQSSSNVANCGKAPNVIAQFGATGAVAAAAGNRASSLTLGLVGSGNGGEVATWRRFNLNPYLQVNYNSYPNNPSNFSMQNGQLPCVSGPGRPWVFTKNPQLAAQVSDPDGGTLFAKFGVASGALGHNNYVHDNGANLVTVGTPGQNQPATAQLAAVPDGWINEDGIYNWSIQITDGELWTSFVGECEFTVDTAVPRPPAVTMTGTPALQGDAAGFSISVAMATTGLYDIDRFIYTTDGSEPQTQGSPSVPAIRGTDSAGQLAATANLSTVAVNGNQNLIRVKAVNKAGTPGPNATCVTSGNSNAFDGPSCSFHVLPLTPATGLLAAWAMDEANGTLLTDSASTTPGNSGHVAHTAGTTGAVTRVPGYDHGNSWTHPDVAGYSDGNKGGLNFDGISGYAAADRVVDTAKSFSAAAWARVDNTGAARAVLSQDGVQNMGFALGYAKDVNAWAVTMATDDQPTSGGMRVASLAPPQIGVWTHLAATYDAATKVVTLYVNGIRQKTGITTAWSAGGVLVIGATKWHGARTDFFRGQIDDAQVWQRVLSTQDVHDLANAAVPLANYSLAEGCGPELVSATSRIPSLQGNWALSETAGAVGKDSSSSLNDLAMTGGYAWTAGHNAGAVHFDGTTGHGTTGAPAVDTSNSYTVSAWAKPDDLTGYYGVASQSGAHTAAFLIRYSPDVNRWIFGTTSADETSSPYTWAIGTSTPQAGVWALVTGVFDRSSQQMKLYVNGKLEATQAAPAVWNAAGSFGIGALTDNQNLFKGSIDQVQTWGTALTDDQVAALNGTTYYDSVSQTSGVASGGVSLGTDPNTAGNPTGCAAQFAKASAGQVAAPRPANLRTDRSYTVEAWVKHTWTSADVAANGPVDPVSRSVITASDSQFSPLLLGYQSATDANGKAHGKWSFLVSYSSTVAGGWIQLSDSDAINNTWTHLVGVYDAATNTTALYVNGVKQNTFVVVATTPVVTGWNGTGELLIGRGIWTGQRTNDWYGGAAGVRVYSGIRRPIDIDGDAASDHPGLIFSH